MSSDATENYSNKQPEKGDGDPPVLIPPPILPPVPLRIPPEVGLHEKAPTRGVTPPRTHPEMPPLIAIPTSPPWVGLHSYDSKPQLYTPPANIRTLLEKEHAGGLSDLTEAESIKVGSWKSFPDPHDIQYRLLDERNTLTMMIKLATSPPTIPGKPNQALLARTFPNTYQQKEDKLMEAALAKLGGPLNPHEHAKLLSRFIWPNPADEKYRQLEERRRLAEKKLGPSLTPQEDARLKAKRVFYSDEFKQQRKLLEKYVLIHDQLKNNYGERSHRVYTNQTWWYMLEDRLLGARSCPDDYRMKLVDNPSVQTVGPAMHADLINGYVHTLPKWVQSLFRANNVKYVTSELSTEAYPFLAKVKPRGDGDSKCGFGCFDAGLYLPGPNMREIFIPDHTLKNGNFTELHNFSGPFFHETGHGIDYALHHPSRSPGFLKAYRDDISKFNDQDRKYLHYYLQGNLAKNYAGREETFAEVFSALEGGFGRSYIGDSGYPEYLLTKFAHVKRFIETTLKDAASEYKQSPTRFLEKYSSPETLFVPAFTYSP